MEFTRCRVIARATIGEVPHHLPVLIAESNAKVTLSLSQRSVDFFKREAKKRRVPYQRMVRALVGAYAEKEYA